jgi:hypothetical protein
MGDLDDRSKAPLIWFWTILGSVVAGFLVILTFAVKGAFWMSTVENRLSNLEASTTRLEDHFGIKKEKPVEHASGWIEPAGAAEK